VALQRELRAASKDDRPLVVGGAPELVSVLRRELIRGGVEAAVREHGPIEGAVALVYVLAGEVQADDREALREAERRRVPSVAVVADRAGRSAPDPPFVLATNIVRVPPGSGFPLDEIGHALVRELGERATPLAARLPVLRRPVCDELISRFARRNALLAAAIWIPGAALPVLTVNEIRLVLRIADAYGFELDRDRVPEVLGVIGSGFGLRAIARQTVGLVPVAGWAVKGAIAFMGTRAIGEAAVRHFERRAPVRRTDGVRARFP
jgi:uncharacterized protein (DUF697 family)